MPEQVAIARTDDPGSVSLLAARLRDWEPRLDLSVDLDNAMIFEPDGTLYAVGLGPDATLRARHREYLLRPGDAIVVPRGVAIDAEPGASLVSIRHDGSPPHHFRERFIQNWGFEFRPAPAILAPDPGSEILPEKDARYRVAFRLASVDPGRPSGRETGSDFHLLIAVSGEGLIRTEGGRRSIPFRRGDLALVPPGTLYRAEGVLLLGQFRLSVEEAYEALRSREIERPVALWSPEFGQPQ